MMGIGSLQYTTPAPTQQTALTVIQKPVELTIIAPLIKVEVISDLFFLKLNIII